MPFNLLLIPLLGGYIFVRFWNRSRISILRADKDRMLIRASIAGFLFLIPSFLISIAIPYYFPCGSGPGFCLYSWWAEHVKFEYMGVSMIAFSLAATSWWPLNGVFKTEREIDRIIKEDADPMEIALKESADLGIALAITLSNEKVYVGIVTHQFNPATPTNNIAIFPLQSGYRDPTTKRLNLKVNYAVIVQTMRNRIDELATAILDHESDCVIPDQDCEHDLKTLFDEWETLENKIDLFEVIIPVSQITSLFYFDDDVYGEYFLKPTRKRKPASSQLIPPQT
ncbi:hypothetical protein BH10ACI2_BH10ACI2_04380 [soil metagenome]